MKQALAFLFLISFFAHTFSKTFIVVDYYSNTAAFAKNCVNKAKPKMHCNGKCQMMKKLKQEEEKNKQNPNRNGNNKEEVLSSRSFFATVQVMVLFRKTSYSLLNISTVTGQRFDIFRPPPSC